MLIGETVNQINQIKSNQMLVFEDRAKPEFPEKNLSEQSREPTKESLSTDVFEPRTSSGSLCCCF